MSQPDELERLTVEALSGPDATSALDGEELDYLELRDVVELALQVGYLMLRSGAQTSRVERSVRTVATALGARGVDVLVFPEGLALTTSSGREFRTRVRRVEALGVQLSRLVILDRLVARVQHEHLDRQTLRQELERCATSAPRYSDPLVALMVGLACAAFARIFGGDWPTFAVTWVASGLAMTVRQRLAHAGFGSVLLVLPTAFVAGLVPAIAHRTGLLPQPGAALAASVLLLVPGVPLINCARDIVRGHLTTGIARGVLGLVWTLCIALGLLIALQAIGLHALTPPGLPQRGLVHLLAADAFWSAFAALGFAMMFQTPPRALPAICLVAACGHALKTSLVVGAVSPLLATLAGAITIGLLAELCARNSHTPAGIYSIPAAIPLVPGVTAFRSMMALIALGLPHSDAEPLVLDAIAQFTNTGLVLASLALGIALPALLLRRA